MNTDAIFLPSIYPYFLLFSSAHALLLLKNFKKERKKGKAEVMRVWIRKMTGEKRLKEQI